MASPRAPYKPEHISGSIMRRSVTLEDKHRRKELQLKLIVPKLKSRSALPVLLISPLALGGKKNYKRFVEIYARYGYICFVFAHIDDEAALTQFRGSGFVQREGPKTVINQIQDDPQYAIDRICDVMLLLNKLPLLDRTIPEIQGRLGKVSILGHSFGSLTAMMAIGLRVEIPEKFLSGIPEHYQPLRVEINGKVLYYWKPRVEICSAIMISPVGPGKFGISEDSFYFNAPCLFITGNKDVSLDAEHMMFWKREAFDKFQSQEALRRYLVLLYEADHGFGDIPGISWMRNYAGWRVCEEHQAIVSRTCVTFTEAFARQFGPALRWLDGPGFSNWIDRFGLFERGLVSPTEEPEQTPVQKRQSQSFSDFPCYTPGAFSASQLQRTQSLSAVSRGGNSNSSVVPPVSAVAPAQENSRGISPVPSAYSSMTGFVAPVEPIIPREIDSSGISAYPSQAACSVVSEDLPPAYTPPVLPQSSLYASSSLYTGFDTPGLSASANIPATAFTSTLYSIPAPCPPSALYRMESAPVITRRSTEPPSYTSPDH